MIATSTTRVAAAVAASSMTFSTLTDLLLPLLALVALGGIAFLLVLFRSRRLRRAVLRLRADFAEDGPHAEVLDMRVDIQDELRAARRAVEAAEGNALASDLPELLARLESAGSRLDAELRILEQDEWPSRGAMRSARERVGQLISSARRVRSAASATLASANRGELNQVHDDVARKVRWVRDGIDALDELDSPRRAAR
jgi:hypothetical protein